ncbi:hypothetical protein [Yoonia sp.]|uniref:hypothetical protein n=1 Tax=Yoonia sp. TaxID=2212373 RepID=UPI002FDA6545
MKCNSLVMAMGFSVLTLAAHQVQAAPCADHATVVATLAQTYGETRQAIGLASDNAVVEVFASLETGTWTITVTQPGGPTCLAASGQAYQAFSDPLPVPGEDA